MRIEPVLTESFLVTPGGMRYTGDSVQVRGFPAFEPPKKQSPAQTKHTVFMDETIDDINGDFDPERPREGIFDAQLSFPGPQFDAPAPITTIRKRDGREAPFEKEKIADAIFNAAQSIGGEDRDRARSLASAVALYLSKTVNGGPPTVDQVQDAVERVLIELGHVRTALAYARYRERRARVRKLREGDLRAVVREWEEAREERPPQPGSPAPERMVRTSDDRLIGWDRNRIVAALQRETGLDESTATLIALDVERQIANAGVTAITAALIRELVSAKLIELGLEDHYQRHTRLGVPLYDAERIICRPNAGAESGVHDPEDTNRALARGVKRAFALSEVYSQPVADAHRRGALYIEGLASVDRLHAATHSPVFVLKHGARIIEAPRRSTPPPHALSYIADLAAFSARMEHYFQRPPVWRAVNWAFAPLLTGDAAECEHLAHALIGEFARRGHAETRLQLNWTLPDELTGEEALRCGGQYCGTDYAAYARAAQAFARAIIQACKQGDTGLSVSHAPQLELIIDDAFFRAPGHQACLESFAELATLGAAIKVGFVRGEPITPAVSETQTVAHHVVINLPRAAASATNGGQAFWDNLDALLDQALQAHGEKQAFLERVYGWNGLGCLAFLANGAAGEPYAPLDTAAHLTGVTGLNECAALITGETMAQPGGAALAGKIIGHCVRRLEKQAPHGVQPLLTAATDREIAARFASADLHSGFDAVRPLLQVDEDGQRLHYTPGATLPESHTASPMERLRSESPLHHHFGHDTSATISLPSDGASPKAWATLIRKAWRGTAVHGLWLRPGTGA